MNTVIIVLAILVAVGRVFITPRLTNIPTWELSYEAFAHIFVGVLIGAWFSTVSRKSRCVCGWSALLISLWELSWFVVQKYLLER